MSRRPAKLTTSFGLAFALVPAVHFWSTPAAATPDFPATVDGALMLMEPVEKIFPPDGCLLCHPTEQGGTTLKPFGTLVHQYGASPYDPNSLKAALMAVGQTSDEFIKDLESGKDPNADTSAAPALPTPQYGCSTTRGGRGAMPAWLVAFVAAAGLAASRSRRRRS